MTYLDCLLARQVDTPARLQKAIPKHRAQDTSCWSTSALVGTRVSAKQFSKKAQVDVLGGYLAFGEDMKVSQATPREREAAW